MITMVAVLVRVWQVIRQVAGLSPSLSLIVIVFPSFFHVFISHLSFLTALTMLRWTVRSRTCLITEPAPHASHSPQPLPQF